MEEFDICVIGGGPSGYAAAMRAVDFKKKVLLVEKERLGGAGVFNGALSSKTLWELSKEIAASQKMMERHGRRAQGVRFPAVLREVRDSVEERSSQLRYHMDLIRQELGERFQFLQGVGRLGPPGTVEVVAEGRVQSFKATNIVLATGSRPRVLPTIPVDEKIIMTSDGIANLTRLPASIVILGAGVIGCEFATIFSNFGKTRVFLIDKEPRILPFEDEDLARVIEGNLETNGVVFHHGAALKTMDVVNGKVAYTLTYRDGREETFTVDKALISVGRVPNVEGLGLEKLGLETRESGHVVDNDTLSNIPGVFAVGDLTADIALVNVGELEGRHAVEKMYGDPPELGYENISTIMFLSPETAGVGLNEKQAIAKSIPFRVATFDFRCIPRATAMRRTQGFFKILVTDDKEKKILGMRAVGEHASSAIQAVALLISMDRGVEELAELIHPHPSITEGVQECARLLLGKSIFKASLFNEYLDFRRFDGTKFVERRGAPRMMA